MRTIAAPILGPRLYPWPDAAYPVWNGREVVIVGGGRPDAGWPSGSENRGAAYDPASDSWRDIPRQLSGIVVAGVSTGAEAVFLTREGAGVRIHA
jgi:hypothetical protein